MAGGDVGRWEVGGAARGRAAGAPRMVSVGTPGAQAEAAGVWVGATVARRVMAGRAQSAGQRVGSVFFVGRCTPVNR